MNKKIDSLNKHTWTRGDGMSFVWLGDLENEVFTPEEYKTFESWFTGQTGPMWFGGVMGVYPSDVIRFIQGLPVID